MTFEQGFGLFLIAFAIGGLLISSFIGMGGLDILAGKLVKFIDSYNSKHREDI